MEITSAVARSQLPVDRLNLGGRCSEGKRRRGAGALISDSVVGARSGATELPAVGSQLISQISPSEYVDSARLERRLVLDLW